MSNDELTNLIFSLSIDPKLTCGMVAIIRCSEWLDNTDYTILMKHLLNLINKEIIRADRQDEFKETTDAGNKLLELLFKIEEEGV